jgi:hypothetical protein
MMADTPLSAVVLPALFAGLVAIFVTAAIERWGGKIGGLLGTLPTTIVPAAAGLAATSASTSDFQAAMAMAPAGMLLNALTLYVWRVLPPRIEDASIQRRLTLTLVVSLSAWAVGAVTTVMAADLVRRSGIPLLAVGWALTVSLAALGIVACRHSPPAPAGSKNVGAVTLLARGVLAASAIGLSVWLAAAGGPLVAGVVAMFPAIFITTMVSLWLSQGEEVPVGAVGPMMLGSTSVAVYGLLAAWALPTLGTQIGSLVAWVAAASLVTVPAWRWLNRSRE